MVVNVGSESASTDSSESNIEMQVTRSGEQSRHFVANSRTPRSDEFPNTTSSRGLVYGGGKTDRPSDDPRSGVLQRIVGGVDPVVTFASVSTPASPCKMSTTPASSDAAARCGVAAGSSSRQRRERDEVCAALAEMSTSCPPMTGFVNVEDAIVDPPSHRNDSLKQKSKSSSKKKGGKNNCSTAAEGGETEATVSTTSCLGGSDHHRPSPSEDDESDPAVASGSQFKADSACASTAVKNHGYAAPLQNATNAPLQKVTSPALPQTPPPAIGSSSHVQFQSAHGAANNAPTTSSNVHGGASSNTNGGSGGAKAKLKHFTSFFSRSRRRGKSVTGISAPGFEGVEVLSSGDHTSSSGEEHHHLPHHRPRTTTVDVDHNPASIEKSDCDVCQGCVDVVDNNNPATASDSPVHLSSGKPPRSAKCSASSKLISTVVGHLTGSPVRRPSAHAAAPPGRHPHLLDSCWGRGGGVTTSASRGQVSSSSAAVAIGADAESPSEFSPDAASMMAQRPRQPLPNALPFSDASLAPFAANFGVALLSANPSLQAMTTRPSLFPPPFHHLNGAAIGANPGVVVDEDNIASSHALPVVSATAAAGIALTSETQKSEYGSLGPDGRLIPRTVHTQIDYMHHLVNDLKEISACSFYWGVMDRYEAERLLDNKPEGTFLLRDSAQEDFLFSVSFRRYGRSLHARIEQWQHKFSFDALDPGVFCSDTVCGLIEHYKDPSCCMFFEPMLTIPLNRSFVFSLQHLCRATICKNLTYDGINLLQLPNVSKDYLKYYHYKQKIRERRYETNEREREILIESLRQ